jgi:4'-phosphopantetheinyl transferase
VVAACGADAERIEVLAAGDGAPEAWVDGARLPVSLSLSHRAGRALVVVAAHPAAVGCDLELIEPRSDAFVREWLAPSEQALLASRGASERARVANLLWTAKEAAAKVRREGLRLDVRRAEVLLDAAGGGDWHRFAVRWPDGAPVTSGWWRSEPGWVLTIAGGPALQPPSRLSAPS